MEKKRTKNSVYKILKSIYYPIISIIAAFIICGIIIFLLGFKPIDAYINLLKGAFGGVNAWSETLVKAMPVIFTGLSYAVAKKCGLINLGAGGQLLVGTLFATVVGTNFKGLNPVLHMILTLLAGFVGGAFYGSIVGVLKVKFRASELITTIMLNYVASNIISYCIAGPIKDVNAGSLPQSEAIPDAMQFTRFIQGSRLHAGIVVVLLGVLFYYFFMWRTTKGYEMRVIGLNPTSGEYSGMNIKTNSIMAMAIAGGFAGIGGAVELLSIQTRLTAGFAANYGFDGIAVALLGNNNPIGIAISGILFGSLSAGSGKMEALSQVPSAVINIIQGAIILFIIGRKIFNIDFSKIKSKLVKKEA